MVTKNEMVAIIAALTTNYDTAAEPKSRDDSKEARNDAYIEPNDAFIDHHKKVG